MAAASPPPPPAQELATGDQRPHHPQLTAAASPSPPPQELATGDKRPHHPLLTAAAAASPPPPPTPEELATGGKRPHHPLLAAATAASLLAVLYLPRPLLQLLLSPAPLSSVLLLLYLLRLGSPTPAAAALPRAPPSQPETAQEVAPPPPAKPQTVFVEPEFASWAPKGRALEVIHEEFETQWGAEEMGLPWTSDSDSDSRSGSDDYDDGGRGLGEYGMIEIELDEDNLIEIDISRCR